MEDSFQYPTGHYEYLVMTLQLTNAPAVFQVFVNDVLRDIVNQFVFLYLDDILIFSKDMASHKNTHQICSVETTVKQPVC